MQLKYREMEVQDVPECAHLLDEQFSHERFDRRVVQRHFPPLLDMGTLKAAVIEDGQKRIVAFGASLFVRDEFVERISSEPVPYLGSRVLETAFTACSAICSPDIIACANANSGLNILILHPGVSEFRPDPYMTEIKTQTIQAFLEAHKGYRVKRVLAEAFGNEELSFYQAGSAFRLLSDYDLWYQHQLPSFDTSTRRPYLLELSREEVWSMDVHPLLSLFSYTPPKCLFSSSEQQLLRTVLNGHTDEELATKLNLSLPAVKKRWVRLFEKVERTVPDLFAEKAGTSTEKLGRGLQRRHILLQYLRSRPEELTPYQLTKGTE